ncbi:MAG: hypothetical protein FJ121_08630 [Deltaproteobacteria bacterium]|nr:hypothetical protein [Deltaproteobacteria bacterium]
MKSSKENLDKIEKALIAAHREPKEFQFPPDWRQQVMQDIHSMAGPTAVSPEPAIKTIFPWSTRAWAAVALAGIVGWLILANLDWHDPWITLKPNLTALESHPAFWLEAGDQDSGLRRVKVTVIQKEVEIEVLSKNLETPGGFWGTQGDAIKKVDFPLELDAQTLGLQEGMATLTVTASDLSWRNGFKGRITTVKKEMVIYYKKSP